MMSSKPRSHTPIAILGAGLTGMSAAIHLKQAGQAYRIFERAPHAGGHATTYVDEGYRFDKTGHLMHLRDAGIRELVMKWVGADSVTVNRKSVIWTHGRYTRYPFQANTYGLPPEVAYECLMGFIKAQSTKGQAAPKNFEEFCVAHFGEGISKHFMIPYNARLWGVHPSEITADWCQRFVPMPKMEDVVAGAVGMNDRELGYNTSFLYPRLGIGELPIAMAKELPEIEYSKAPEFVNTASRELHFADEIVTYDALISTAPLKAFCENVQDAPTAVREASARLRCNSLEYLDVAARVPSGTDHHWVYVPEAKYPMYRLGCYSHFSAAMAPEGGSCFYVELAERSKPDLSRVVPEVAAAMVEMGILNSPDDIAFVRSRRIEHAYVVFDHHYFGALEAITPFLKSARIVSAGRYGAWNYSSMEDALIFGRDAAKEASQHIV